MIGFLLSIILLVVLGIIVSWAYKRKLRQINKDASVLIGLLIIGLFWTFGILFYLNIFGTNGADLMWNFPFNLGIAPDKANMVPYAIILFLSYPLWYLWGLERGYQIWGRRTYQEGALFLFRMNKPGQGLPKDKKMD
jgi:branched-subunit amino acid permease